jgi:dUTP pyrophosphatase
VIVKYKKFSESAREPTYAHDSDAGADLYVASDEREPLWPDETRTFFTDLGIELPVGYEAQVRPRSSLSKRGIIAHFGTCDAWFRGNIGIVLTNTTRELFVVSRGDRIAQLVIAPVTRGVFECVDELGTGDRAERGWGSTGQ